MSDESIVLQTITPSNFIAGIIIYACLSAIISFFRNPKYPSSVDSVGNGKGLLANIKDTFHAYTRAQEWLKNGYELYHKNGKSFILPGQLGHSTEIVVPRSQMKWMLEQPDTILSTSESHYDTLHGKYSFIDKHLLQDPYHERVIYKQLSRNLNALIPAMSDEVIFDMDMALGVNTKEFTRVNVMKMFFEIIPKITNRMFVGKELCRNQDYIDNCVAFTEDVIRNMLLFGITPKFFKDVIGPIAALPAKYHFNKTAKYTYGPIQERLKNIRLKDAGENKDWEEPNDYITWHIRTALADGRPDELVVKRIAQRLMPINFASIHTTSMTGHCALLDIFSTDPKLGVVEAIREEAERIFTEDGGQWTKAGLTRMFKTDSAIRESMRYSSFATTVADRKVIALQGITNPDEGWHAPYGAHLSCHLYGIHFDPELHDEDPRRFDAFRYSRGREEYEARPIEEKDSKEGLKLRGTGLITTSDTHLSFGHGRHACPGRFFVAHELKMIIAYLVMNYDIKYLDERPQPKWLGRTMVPPSDACIEVRRRDRKI